MTRNMNNMTTNLNRFDGYVGGFIRINGIDYGDNDKDGSFVCNNIGCDGHYEV